MILVASVPYAAYSIVNGRAEAQRLDSRRFRRRLPVDRQPRTRPGPVLTRHPGEVFWQTRRPAVEPDSSDPDAIDRLIDRLGVAYLLIDEDRYVNATSSPLTQYVERYPDRVILVWTGNPAWLPIRVFETRREK